MNELVSQILNVKHFAAGSNIALPVPVCLENAIDACQQHIVANVEFTIIVKERFVYVGLNYIGECLPILMLLFCHALFYFAKRG